MDLSPGKNAMKWATSISLQFGADIHNLAAEQKRYEMGDKHFTVRWWARATISRRAKTL